ncbi:MAG: aminopeptidase PepB [Gammaproteobacteria bacterium]|nr:aminopeptidase PepB [Gammaproteobacteria bacterium]MDH5628784.1 aminopeptidase PepB [Gammaproteobacteria bacterium]
MSKIFTISLTTDSIDSKWGDKANLSFDSNGAIIHLQSLEDNAKNLETIQKAGRTINGMKMPKVELTGTWTLEAQWHFWQGLYSPIKMPELEYAELPEAEMAQLKSRIKIYGWARKLINLSPEDLPPMQLATQVGEYLTQLAPDSVNYSIISGEELKDKGYVGIYGVGRGSVNPPALLTLDYCPKGLEKEVPAAALVGKGITFDSGGYSMKQTLSMLHMKSDMGGAATVSAALALAIANGLNKRVKLYLCCAENLVSGHAYKLADILKYRNGTSVEIVNTDAEGRLVLADGLIDASETDTPLIIDAATLTGAAMTAVGDSYNALFSMDENLASQFDQIAKQEFDLTWRLPLTMSHQNNCPSAYADTANSRPVPGGGTGGASNAAAFLSRFVRTPETGWIHLDLAACYKDSENALWSAGATGRGIRSIAAFLNQL